MIINQSNLQGLFRSFRTLFQEAFAGAPSVYGQVATTVPSATAEQAYAWLGNFPRMREWLGDRTIQNLKQYDYTIQNKDFELTIGVERNSIDDDQYGVYSPMFQEMGRAVAAHPDELVFALLKAGFATLCYDGQYFFDTDHPVGIDVVSSVSNSGGGSGSPWFLIDSSRAIKPLLFQQRKTPEFVAMNRLTDDNVFFQKQFIYGVDSRDNVGFSLWQLAYGSKQTLDAAAYAVARAAMMNVTDDGGKPLGIMPDLLVVGPGLESAGRAILLNDRDAAGATNTWQGTAKLLVSPWLAAA